MKFLYILISFLLFPVTEMWGQHADGLYLTDKKYEDDPYDELTYSYYGMNLLTDNVYMGRRDTMANPYITPYFGHQTAIGFYGKVSASYAPNGKDGRFDLLALEGGYDRSFGYHIIMGASIEYDKYQKNSPTITACYTNKFNVYLLYRNGFFEPQISFNSLSGKVSDVYVSGSVAHDFHLLDNTLNILPTITANMGSNNFYDYYFINKVKQFDNITLNNNVVIKDAGNVKPLDVEVAIRVNWRINAWLLCFKPTWAIPLSEAKLYLPSGTRNETLKNSVFAELDICYRHERK